MTTKDILTLLAMLFGSLLGAGGMIYGVRTNARQNHLRLEFEKAAEEKEAERNEAEQRDRRATEWREDYMTARREMDSLRKELRDMHAEHRVEIENLRREHSEEIAALRTEHDSVLNQLRVQYERDLEETRNENARLRVRVSDMEAELQTKRVVASVVVTSGNGTVGED